MLSRRCQVMSTRLSSSLLYKHSEHCGVIELDFSTSLSVLYRILVKVSLFAILMKVTVFKTEE